MGTSRKGKESASHDHATNGDHLSSIRIIDLPDDILSHIASFLDLGDQFKLLSTHPIFLALANNHLSPIPSSIRRLLERGPPYPKLLAKLPLLSLFVPEGDGTFFMDILVQARPRWILERLEYGRWSDSVWRAAFEKRFLPSWKRYKGEDDSWRAIFLRTLGRIEHRNLGCTHEESWTRFLTLHRNGSASINRIYSRQFDPYEIYDELKHQNNFASKPTQVRVILHLHDLRIIALGVSLTEPSLFVNPNAHLLLHPPLLRGLAAPPNRQSRIPGPPQARENGLNLSESASQTHRAASVVASTSRSANSNEAYFPMVRTLSPSGPAITSYGLSDAPMPAGQSSSPISPGLKSSFSGFLTSRSRRHSSNAGDNEEASSRLGGLLTGVRSRDRDTGMKTREGEGEASKRRSWSFIRTRSSTASSPYKAHEELPAESDPPAMPTLRESSSSFSLPIASPPASSGLSQSTRARPYEVMYCPRPARSHGLYPNYTQPALGESCADLSANDPPKAADRRGHHEEVEDDEIGTLWSAGETSWGGDGRKMAEWDEVKQSRLRWVGPMIIIAQLHPCDRTSAHPAGAMPYGPVEGDSVDLGPKGMFVSMGFEDLDAIAPWLELRNSGGNSSEPRRPGLGFQ